MGNMTDIIHQLFNGHMFLPYMLVFFALLICGFGLPIPEDITLIAAGIASYYGYGNVYLMIAVAFAGIIIGDTVLFSLGRRFGDPIKKTSLFRRVFSDSVLHYIENRLNEHGSKVVFAARFMPGLRAPIYFTAGLMKIRYIVFFTYDFLAALISVPVVIYFVYYLGENIDYAVKMVQRIQHGIAILVFIVIAFIAIEGFLSYRKLKKARQEGEQIDGLYSGNFRKNNVDNEMI